MFSTRVVQSEKEVKSLNTLGYPTYLLTIFGVWKILDVLAILITKFPLLKEWAYAGFFFVMSGAIISHLAVKDEVITLFDPILLLILTVASWDFGPANRKLKKE